MNNNKKFNYKYWGIDTNVLEDTEEKLEKLAKKYKIEDKLYDTEELAQDIAKEDLKNTMYPFYELTTIIMESKAKALINCICKEKNLDKNNFNIDTTTGYLSISYKEETLC